MANIIAKKENNQLITEFVIESKLNILVEGQTNNSKQLQEIRNYLQHEIVLLEQKVLDYEQSIAESKGERSVPNRVYQLFTLNNFI